MSGGNSQPSMIKRILKREQQRRSQDNGSGGHRSSSLSESANLTEDSTRHHSQDDVPSHPESSARGNSGPDGAPDPATNFKTGKNLGGVLYEGLRTTLRVIEKCGDLLAPLGTVAAGLGSVFDIIETAQGNKEDFQTLCALLKNIATRVEKYKGSTDSLSERIDNLCNHLTIQITAIEDIKAHNLPRRLVEGTKDAETVRKAFRDISALLDGFKLDTELNTERNTELIREVVSESRQAGPRVYWLNGMAGTGKSAIALSLSRMLNAAGSLGASFFCSRRDKEGRRDITRIIPTLAFKMAQISTAFRSALIQALTENEDAGDLNIGEQFSTLIVDPIQVAFMGRPSDLVLILDAIDECDDKNAIEKLLDIILAHAACLQIKIFITSRPEASIRDRFLRPTEPSHHSILRLHDVEDHIINGDIAFYLKCKLSDLHLTRRGHFSRTSSGWPTLSQLSILVQLADKLFIYAFTAYEYIRDPGKGNHENRLTKLIAPELATQLRLPMSKRLDEIYAFILDEALEDVDDEEALDTIHSIAAIVSVRDALSVDGLGDLLGIGGERVISALGSLHSLILVPERHTNGHVSTLHASFADYIMDEKRSGHERWFVGASRMHLEILNRCLDIMTAGLRFNAAGLLSSYVSCNRSSGEKISPHLAYSCRFWIDQLSSTPVSLELLNIARKFLGEKFLLWLELLSLLGRSHDISRFLLKLNAVASKGVAPESATELSKFLQDANDFVVAFRQPISFSPTHIYLSALPFVHPESEIAHRYQREFPNTLTLESPDLNRTIHSILCVETHSKRVNMVVFSPDSRLIASSSDDCAIRVWDSETGEAVVQPFEGHTDLVLSMIFWPDSKQVMSGSRDCTIRVWDLGRGEVTPMRKRLEGHTSGVRTLAFSPNRERIVSGSDDCAIRIYETNTGNLVLRPLDGHSMTVSSVAFSQEGGQIASGSSDCTIRLWDAKTGDVLQAFENHTDCINSVAFSPNGMRVVSGSDDLTIQVWDVETGQPVMTPLEGHNNSVLTVQFSPDGKQIASSSGDSTILLWDADTGEELLSQPLEGHTSWVQSIMFSPDGKRIVSGSDDSTIRVWNTGIAEAVPKSVTWHRSPFLSVAFSSDCKRIVSGSRDSIVRVWKAETGEATAQLLPGHADWVWTVALSPDGRHIASGSRDRTIRVWCADTGDAICEPLKGHTGSVSSVAFSPNSQLIASGSHDSTIRVWKSETGQPMLSPLEHTDWVLSAIFSPDGKHITSGCGDGTVRVWIAETGELLRAMNAQTGLSIAVAFSPNGQWFASVSNDMKIRLWDINTEKVSTKPLEGHTDLIWSLAFSPDGKHLVSGSKDRTIRVWNTETGEMVMRPLRGHTQLIFSVAFSPDGRKVVSGSGDCTIRVWDVETGEVAASQALSPPLDEFCDDIATPVRDEITFSSDPTHGFPAGLFSGLERLKGEVIWLDDEGWIRGPQEQRLFWVPWKFRWGLWWPRTAAIIGTPSYELDLSRFVHGTAWEQCCTPIEPGRRPSV